MPRFLRLSTALPAAFLLILGGGLPTARTQIAEPSAPPGRATPAGVTASPGASEASGGSGAPGAPAAGGSPAPAPPLSDEEMMQAYLKTSSPNEHHRNMAKMVGTWDATVKYWSAPGAPPEEMKGTAKFTSLFEGRYIQLEYKGEMGGRPFAGQGLFAYDNGLRKHTAIWIDSMSTGFTHSTADCEKNCTILKGQGEFFDPITGQKVTGREITRWQGDDRMVHEMYGPSQDGKVAEFKMMEITYTRR